MISNDKQLKPFDQTMSPEIAQLHKESWYLRNVGVIWAGSFSELKDWLKNKEI